MQQCDRSWELDAVREGRLSPSDLESFERHRRACEICGALAADAERLRQVGQSLGLGAPGDEVRVRRLRGRILREAALADARSPSPRGILLACAVALVVLVGSFVVWSRLHAPQVAVPTPRAVASSKVEAVTVLPGPATTWSRRRDGTTERVRLDDGLLVLEVRHQGPDERFVVEPPDGEIEVRGTRFEVVVREKATWSVRVLEGRVALRRGGAPELLLGAGDSWTSPTLTVVAAPAAVAAVAAAPSTSAAVTPRATAGSDGLAYERAMKLYRDGEYEDAARAFRSFVAAHPQDPAAEDASFLEASALTQSGRADAAALVAERFLERYPGSIHARDAAILVARAARGRGDCDAARRALAPWSATSSPGMSAALGRCAP